MDPQWDPSFGHTCHPRKFQVNRLSFQAFSSVLLSKITKNDVLNFLTVRKSIWPPHGPPMGPILWQDLQLGKVSGRSVKFPVVQSRFERFKTIKRNYFAEKLTVRRQILPGDRPSQMKVPIGGQTHDPITNGLGNVHMPIFPGVF